MYERHIGNGGDIQRSRKIEGIGMKAHCLFEQSGTFKNEFKKLGIEAEDYDILDDFGETENQCDLFKAICDSYDGKQTVLDNIGRGDVVMAFFPCTRFEAQVILEMKGEQYIANGKKRIDWFGIEDTLKYSMKLNGELNKMYEYISKLAILCIRGGVENGY